MEETVRFRNCGKMINAESLKIPFILNISETDGIIKDGDNNDVKKDKCMKKNRGNQLVTLSNSQLIDNLLSNINLRKILLHPRLKKDITFDKYSSFIKSIQDYTDFINKVSTLLESETSLQTDVIKYKDRKSTRLNSSH